VRHLSSIGYDARFGARPLQRAIERVVVSPLARWLLENREARDLSLAMEWESNLKIRIARS
jgi:ATP-dependent Clp protease ATP-binding subunit ClpC